MKKLILVAATLALLLTQCSHPTKVAGGSTTTDNAKVTGSVFYASGAPAKGAAVRLRAKNYVHALGSLPDSLLRRDTTTNDSGFFLIDSLKTGDYRIEVNDRTSEALLLNCRITSTKDSVAFPGDTLRPYTAIAGKVDSSQLKRTPIFIQLFGIDRIAPVDSLSGAFSIPDLPPAMYTVRIIFADSSVNPIVIDSVVTSTGVTQITTKTETVSPSQVMGPWTQASPNVSTVTCIAISPSGDIFIGTKGGGVYRSIDNGATWTAINNGLSNLYVQCLTMSPNGSSLYAGTQNEVFFSADNGATWTAITNHTSLRAIMDIRSIAVSPDGAGGTILFTGTKDNGIFKSPNNGATWTVINTGDKLTDVTFIQCLAVISSGTNRGIVFAGTDRNGVFRSNDNGSTWTQVNTGLTDISIKCLAVSPDGKKIFAGNTEGVFVSSDSGANWTLLTIGQSFFYINSIAITGSEAGGSNIFAGSYNVGVFHSGDGGATWTLVNTGLSSTNVNMLTFSGADIFVGADYDGVFVSHNNGDSWIATNNGLTNVDVHAFVASGNNLFAGTTRGIFLSTDNGLGWKEVDSGLTNWRIEALTVMQGGASGDNIFAASGSGISRSTDNGSRWTAVTDNWSNITINTFAVTGTTLFVGAGNGGATVDHGIFMTSDLGVTWTSANTGFTNVDSQGITSFAVDSHEAGATTIFAGTDGKGIYRSTNTGVSWIAANNGLTEQYSLRVHSLAVSSIGTNGAMLIAGTENGVFVSTNNGDQWTPASSGLPASSNVYCLAVAANGNGGSIIFAATGGGPLFSGIYVSIDNGAKWTSINAGLSTNWIYALIVKDQYLFAGFEGCGVWKAQIQK
jgi:hypothetical protein